MSAGQLCWQQRPLAAQPPATALMQLGEEQDRLFLFGREGPTPTLWSVDLANTRDTPPQRVLFRAERSEEDWVLPQRLVLLAGRLFLWKNCLRGDSSPLYLLDAGRGLVVEVNVDVQDDLLRFGCCAGKAGFFLFGGVTLKGAVRDCFHEFSMISMRFKRLKGAGPLPPARCEAVMGWSAGRVWVGGGYARFPHYDDPPLPELWSFCLRQKLWSRVELDVRLASCRALAADRGVFIFAETNQRRLFRYDCIGKTLCGFDNPRPDLELAPCHVAFKAPGTLWVKRARGRGEQSVGLLVVGLGRRQKGLCELGKRPTERDALPEELEEWEGLARWVIGPRVSL